LIIEGEKSEKRSAEVFGDSDVKLSSRDFEDDAYLIYGKLRTFVRPGNRQFSVEFKATKTTPATSQLRTLVIEPTERSVVVLLPPGNKVSAKLQADYGSGAKKGYRLARDFVPELRRNENALATGTPTPKTSEETRWTPGQDLEVDIDGVKYRFRWLKKSATWLATSTLVDNIERLLPRTGIAQAVARERCNELNDTQKNRLPDAYVFALPTQETWLEAAREDAKPVRSVGKSKLAADSPLREKFYGMKGNVWQWLAEEGKVAGGSFLSEDMSEVEAAGWVSKINSTISNYPHVGVRLAIRKKN
jgi:hypothetical protein